MCSNQLSHLLEHRCMGRRQHVPPMHPAEGWKVEKAWQRLEGPVGTVLASILPNAKANLPEGTVGPTLRVPESL